MGGNGTTQRVGEPRLIIPALTSFYDSARDLSYLIIRLAVGATVFMHGWPKLTGAGLAAFASGSLARRGIEPSLPLAYVVFFNEIVGSICVMLGLFTRLVAASLAIEFAVITFVAHWGNGYAWTSAGGGWEYPLLGGLLLFAIALRGGGPYSVDRKLGWEL